MHTRSLSRRAGLILLVTASLAACTTTGPAPVPTPSVISTPPTAHTTLTRGPYLQDVTDTAATIVWHTADKAVGGLAIRPQSGGAVTVSREAAAGTEHVLRAIKLESGTAYSYRVLDDDAPLGPEAVFHTAPRTGSPTPFTFLVWGDSGCGCLPQDGIAARMNAAPADLLLHTGDMIYEDGQESGFDPRFFAPYAPLLARTPVYPVLGNHDVISGDGDPWLRAFFLPGDQGAHNTRYYSFDYGNAHFIALDSEEDFSPTSRQYNWLLTDLAGTDAQSATWRFAFFHRPPYSSGLGHGSSFDIREAWGPLFERFGVDIVFNGHEHNYERSLPRRDYTAVGGTHSVIYIVTGGGGKQLYNVGKQPWSAFADMRYNYVSVKLDGPSLKLEAIDADGKVFDTLDLSR
ncbi:MAG: metallophosphoesterase [Chloroflexia bacterium]